MSIYIFSRCIHRNFRKIHFLIFLRAIFHLFVSFSILLRNYKNEKFSYATTLEYLGKVFKRTKRKLFIANPFYLYHNIFGEANAKNLCDTISDILLTYFADFGLGMFCITFEISLSMTGCKKLCWCIKIREFQL